MIKTYEDIKINKDETARLLGYGKNKPEKETLDLIDSCLKILKPDFKVLYKRVKVSVSGGQVLFEGLKIRSRNLASFLDNSEETVIFCATIGLNFDRELKKLQVTSPAKSAVFQAVGASLAEALCDRFCKDFCIKKRFSPGFGDLDLSVQRDIFNILNCEKYIGVTLTGSNLMMPTKSVTAFGKV